MTFIPVRMSYPSGSTCENDSSAGGMSSKNGDGLLF